MGSQCPTVTPYRPSHLPYPSSPHLLAADLLALPSPHFPRPSYIPSYLHPLDPLYPLPLLPLDLPFLCNLQKHQQCRFMHTIRAFIVSVPAATSGFNIEKPRQATVPMSTLLTVLALSLLFLLHPVWELHVGIIASFHRLLILRHCRLYHLMIHLRDCNSNRALQRSCNSQYGGSPYVSGILPP